MTRSIVGGRSIASMILLTAGLSSAVGAQSPWTDERVGSLFPPPPEADGARWLEPGAVTVQTLEAAFADWSALGAITGTDVQPPARIRSERVYRTVDGVIEVAIDTEDLETSGVLIAVNGFMIGPEGELRPGNDEVMSMRDQLVQQGLEPLPLPAERLGLVVPAIPDGGSLLAVRSGGAGTITMACDYAGCDADMRSLLGLMRLDDIDAFTTYDHRRAPAGR